MLTDVCCEQIVLQLSASSLVWANHVGCRGPVCVKVRSFQEWFIAGAKGQKNAPKFVMSCFTRQRKKTLLPVEKERAGERAKEEGKDDRTESVEKDEARRGRRKIRATHAPMGKFVGARHENVSTVFFGLAPACITAFPSQPGSVEYVYDRRTKLRRAGMETNIGSSFECTTWRSMNMTRNARTYLAASRSDGEFVLGLTQTSRSCCHSHLPHTAGILSTWRWHKRSSAAGSVGHYK